MSSPQTVAFTESDELLYQKVRNELLGKAEDTELANVATPEELAVQAQTQAQRKQLWLMVVVLAVLSAIASVFAQIMLILAVFLFGLLVYKLLKLPATTKPKVRPDLPPKVRSPWRRFLVSFMWFSLIGVLVFSPVELAWLIAVLLLHESGHFLGMRYFDYRDLQMFFIPFFGAAVHGEKRGVPAWQEGIVLLLGPLPGLILGCGIYFLDLAVPQPILRSLAAWLVAINFLNLLPFEPLDGGRFCNRLLFSRFHWLEAVSVVLATVGFAFLCLNPGWICLTLSAAFAIFILAPARYKTATAAFALKSRWPNLPHEPADLSEEQWRDLFTITRGKFGSDAKLLAGQMENVHTRALLHPESGRATFGLFAVYLTALLLAIVTASVTNLGEDAGRLPIRIKTQVTGSEDGEPKQ